LAVVPLKLAPVMVALLKFTLVKVDEAKLALV
jgi:hypothetical protein